MVHLMSIAFGWSAVRIVTVREVIDEGQFKDARTSGQQEDFVLSSSLPQLVAVKLCFLFLLELRGPFFLTL